jgi:tRNA(Ile)-lysidine synthase
MRAKLKSVALTKQRASKKELIDGSTSPLRGQEFALLIEAFAPLAPKLALAVSGGSDSMALALCVKRWLKKPYEATAFIVDHGLRKESAAEAEHVRAALAKLGYKAEILRWRHGPVARRLHEAARKARYDLLLEACHKRGIGALLFAHQREDQAETILMRFAKGSGIEGLAGMKAESRRENIRILRPFLSIPRARLTATCVAAKTPFVSDPSNTSEKFARGRLRRVMPHLATEGFTIERLLDLGIRANDVRAALDHYVEAFLRVAGKVDMAGTIRLDLEHLRAIPQAVGERALSVSLHMIGGDDYAPLHAPLVTLLKALCADQSMPGRTLHGCFIYKDKRHVTIMREYAAINEAPPIAPGETLIWDHHWCITLDPKAEKGFRIRPLGNPPHKLLERLAPHLRKLVPQGRARATLPSLWRNEKLALVPALLGTGYESPVSAMFLHPGLLPLG